MLEELRKMDYQSFWTNESYAIVGHSEKKNFPKRSYEKLKKLGKKVFPVDPGIKEIKGDMVYPDLSSIPENVEAIIIEVPKEETRDWIQKAADQGIKNAWIHMECETPEAIALAKEKRMNLRYGTCAVMYLHQGFAYHSIHKLINKMLGIY